MGYMIFKDMHLSKKAETMNTLLPFYSFNEYILTVYLLL